MGKFDPLGFDPQGKLKKKSKSPAAYNINVRLQISKSIARMCILFLSRRFPSVRLGYVTEMN